MCVPESARNRSGGAGNLDGSLKKFNQILQNLQIFIACEFQGFMLCFSFLALHCNPRVGSGR